MLPIRLTSMGLLGVALVAHAQLPVIEHDTRELREENGTLFGAWELDETIPKMVQHTILPVGQTLTVNFDDDTWHGRKIHYDKLDPAGLGQKLESWTINSDAVVSARVIAGDSYLCSNYNFICTDLEMEVTEIFYQKRHPFFLGKHFILARPGGSLVINGRPVIARDTVLSDMREGGRYLLFLHHQDNGIFISSEALAFELRGSTVLSPHAGNGSLKVDESQLTGMVKQIVQTFPDLQKR